MYSDEFLAQTYPISDCQWGLCTTDPVSALIAVIHDSVSLTWSVRSPLDVREAFDSVPHAPCLEKLSEIGLNPYITKWIKSYLTNREQFVVVDGSSSLILKPLLYYFYINDVVWQISSR